MKQDHPDYIQPESFQQYARSWGKLFMELFFDDDLTPYIHGVKIYFCKYLIISIVVNCLVFSKLFYCSNVWSNTTESNLDKVQKVQNFACRIVSGVKKFDHITPVLRAMQWLPIRQQLYYRNAVMAFNCVTGCAPDSFNAQTFRRAPQEIHKNSRFLSLSLQLDRDPFITGL